MPGVSSWLQQLGFSQELDPDGTMNYGYQGHQGLEQDPVSLIARLLQSFSQQSPATLSPFEISENFNKSFDESNLPLSQQISRYGNRNPGGRLNSVFESQNGQNIRNVMDAIRKKHGLPLTGWKSRGSNG